MNVLYNTISPVNLMDYKRIAGETEAALVNGLIEVLVRKILGLKAEWIETILCCKLAIHFDGSWRGLFGMDQYDPASSFMKNLQAGGIALLSEGVESRLVYRSFTRGFHLPYYGWRELAAIFVARVTSDFLIGITNGKIADILQDQINEMVAQINRESEATRKMFGMKEAEEE